MRELGEGAREHEREIDRDLRRPREGLETELDRSTQVLWHED